mmetsp:Transcript_31564/g.69017  ORF Transcript_31564/g.69017 Transcript_31564/m.69017 type:complete len:208 (-) Transcript_31564:187-810(-)
MALPKASRRSDDSSAAAVILPDDRESCASDVMQSLIDSVLPAPLSPLTSTDCAPPSSSKLRYAVATIECVCGGIDSPAPILRIRSGEQHATGLYGLTTTSTGPTDVKISSRCERARSALSIAAKETSSSCTRSHVSPSEPETTESASNAFCKSVSSFLAPRGGFTRSSKTESPCTAFTLARAYASSSSTGSHTHCPTDAIPPQACAE